VKVHTTMVTGATIRNERTMVGVPVKAPVDTEVVLLRSGLCREGETGSVRCIHWILIQRYLFTSK
jgi:hypothetical protein